MMPCLWTYLLVARRTITDQILQFIQNENTFLMSKSCVKSLANKFSKNIFLSWVLAAN